MMPEISLHILDVVQNSIKAGASFVQISVFVRTREDRLEIWIEDNGDGMSKEEAEKAEDPFYTTRTTRPVGLGLPFFKMAAQSTGGDFSIESGKGRGTCVKAGFVISHIDRMPMGDLNGTIEVLIQFNPKTDFLFLYEFNGKQFSLDTRQIKEVLEGVPLNHPDVLEYIREYLIENKQETDGGAVI